MIMYKVKKVLNHNLYEEYMITLLNESPVINTIIKKLLNQLLSNTNNNNNLNLKNVFSKIKSYYYDNNSNKYFLLFNKRSSILNSLSKNTIFWQILPIYASLQPPQ